MSGRYAQYCALARAAELLGERWTLLVVRELLLGPKRFTDVADGLGEVSPSVLSARLQSMESDGLVRRSSLPPPAASTVYELTEDGHALRPAILALIRWGGRFLNQPRKGERFEPPWMCLALEACASSGPTPETRFLLKLPKGRQEESVLVEGGPDGTRVRLGTGDADVTIRARAETVFGLMNGALTLETFLEKRLGDLSGRAEALREFPLLFRVKRDDPGKGDDP